MALSVTQWQVIHDQITIVIFYGPNLRDRIFFFSFFLVHDEVLTVKVGNKENDNEWRE
jgi:hypothetical protein